MSNNKGLSSKNKIFKFSSPPQGISNSSNSNINSSFFISNKDNKDNFSITNNTKKEIFYDQRKNTNHSFINKKKFFRAKTFQLESNKTEECKNDELNQYKSTFIRDFKSYQNYPINTIFQKKKTDNQKLYWFVAYDKLMKTKNVIKILNYNNNISEKTKSNSMTINSELNIKTKTLKIPNFEMFFVKGYDKPFVRPKKNSYIFVNLYLLSKNEINKILNYINRIEDSIDIDIYLSRIKQNICQYIDFNNNSNNNNSDISYPYCYIYYLGKFMNISMFLFTNTFHYIKKYNINHKLIYSLPNTKKLFKLVKIITKLFPEDKPDSIINNIIKTDLYSNSIEKKNDIMKNLTILKHSVPNKLLLNKILRETITGIQTNSSISVSPLPFDSLEQLETSKKIKFQKKKNFNLKQNIVEIKKSIPLGYKFEIKNSFNSINNLFLNGQNITNYLSTNHTILPSNSIRTYSNKNKNSIKMPLLAIPSEINHIKKNGQSIVCLTTKNIHNRVNSKIKKKKINSKLYNNKVKNNEDRENIDIKNILNKKKEERNDINKIINNNNNIGCYKKKKNDKKNKIKDDKKNKYTTPKKTKKIKYYE